MLIDEETPDVIDTFRTYNDTDLIIELNLRLEYLLTILTLISSKLGIEFPFLPVCPPVSPSEDVQGESPN